MAVGRGRSNGGRRVAALAATGVLVTAGAVAVAGQAFAALPGEAPVATATRAQPLVVGTPCSVSAKSCVDLDSQRAWLFQDGKILRGPVPVATGGNGQPTPVGHSLRVYRKDADHKSQESRLPNGAPRSDAAERRSSTTAGSRSTAAVRTARRRGACTWNPDDAKAWFDYLQVGDKVQVVKAAEELAARKQSAAPAPPPTTTPAPAPPADRAKDDGDD